MASFKPTSHDLLNCSVQLVPQIKIISVLSKVGQIVGSHSLLKSADACLQVTQRTQSLSRQVNEAAKAWGQGALRNSS